MMPQPVYTYFAGVFAIVRFLDKQAIWFVPVFPNDSRILLKCLTSDLTSHGTYPPFLLAKPN